MADNSEGYMLWAGVCFFIFIVTVVYALLNIFVFNNFRIDVYFIVGIAMIVPGIICGILSVAEFTSNYYNW